MVLRRLGHAALIVSMLAAGLPAPAGAVSTAAEIAQAKEEDKQILEQYNLITDPLLNAWVTGVGEKLWTEVARRDVPYNVKILDSQEINSFTIGGGYIYINEATLDFVQSDDELAAVLAHETGHNERRHTVTLPAKAQALSLLFGIASIFSPFIYRFGQLAEAGLIAKQSRANELQADQYGLQLMARAGYDPDAMFNFMKHLDVEEHEQPSIVDKYFQDHPGFPSREAHLLGYEALDPTKRTTDQILVQGLHDEQEARYSYSSIKFADVLKSEPGDATALLHEGEDQLALGQPEKSQQTLAEAAEKGNAETRNTALLNIKALRESQAHFTLTHPNLAPLRQQLADAQTREAAADAAISTRRDAGRDQIKSVDGRVQNISYGIPDFSRIAIRPGSRLDTVLKNLNAMARSIDKAFTSSQTTINSVGTMERNKESGVVKENADILKELGAPLASEPVPPQSLTLLPSYPRMLDDLELADGDMIRALDAARSSLAMLDVSLGDLDEFIKLLGRAQLDFHGDLSQIDYNALLPVMQRASERLGKAAVAGSQASQLLNIARSRQLQSRITMLGVGYPQDRYATLQYALQQRVKNDGLDFASMQHQGLTPGEVAAASIVAADTNTTPMAVVEEAKAGNRQIIDVANQRGMHGEALEIFLGLVYLDYTDDPVKEAHGH
ncbi:MAG TPA: M48 family metalloprotease [Candidatus Baltobacteraceae bacterium]|nr:M48 family metalloprotease [Candidatus Baltobacteraceae bacterium]